MPDAMHEAMQMPEWDDELSSFEYMMYRADGDHRSRTTITSIETIDVTPDWERVRSEVDRVSRLVARLRQRVVAPIVPIAPAKWVYDPDFDLHYHLRRVVLPSPADFRTLLDHAEVMHATPLDLGRPLWEMTLIEGLDMPDAEAAIVWKLSHAVTDGVGGMVLDALMRHDVREPELGPMPAIPAPQDVSPVDMTRSALRGLPLSIASSTVKRTARLLGEARSALQAPNETVEGAVRSLGALQRMTGSAGVDQSPLLARRGQNRRFESMRFPLAALRTPAKAHGCSVNDAYIAGICGALRLYHEAMGVPIDALPLAMPVNVRAPSDSAKAANQWSAATLAAPVGIVDPVERMKKVRELVLTARSDSNLNAAAMIAPIVNWVPNSVIGSFTAGSLGIDVQASNVPGHPRPRYLAGARIVRSVPIGPAPGVALMIAMISLNGECHVGLNYDTEAISDAELFADCLERGFAEVFDAPPPAEAKPRAKKKGAKSASKKNAAKQPAQKRPAAERSAS